MDQATPTRRALVDLSTNTLVVGSPSAEKRATNHKKPIDGVTEPEYPRPTSRVKVQSAGSQSSLKDEVQLPETKPTITLQGNGLPGSAIPSPTMEKGVSAAEVEEGDSQISSISNVDFDPDDTMQSQQTAATELTQQSQTRSSQHAETLRLRLRLAHFKVKTNQTHLPLSQLRLSTTQSQDSSPIQEPSLPTLLPAPILKPTAYSARTITQDRIPSSPPCSPEERLRRNVQEESFRTPALPRQSVTVRQARSPSGDQGIGSRRAYDKEDCLTSSAVRGKAAIGLLGLR